MSKNEQDANSDKALDDKVLEDVVGGAVGKPGGPKELLDYEWIAHAREEKEPLGVPDVLPKK